MPWSSSSLARTGGGQWSSPPASRGFFNNTLVVFSQHNAAHQDGRVPGPVPTYVAGFKQWLSLNRHVMKGQGGYAILCAVHRTLGRRRPQGVPAVES
jgi:hypothetical protein